MNDWPTQDQHKIADFDKELKEYFGSPLTIEKIHLKKFNGKNAWQVEAGSSDRLHLGRSGVDTIHFTLPIF